MSPSLPSAFTLTLDRTEMEARLGRVPVFNEVEMGTEVENLLEKRLRDLNLALANVRRIITTHAGQVAMARLDSSINLESGRQAIGRVVETFEDALGGVKSVREAYQPLVDGAISRVLDAIEPMERDSLELNIRSNLAPRPDALISEIETVARAMLQSYMTAAGLSPASSNGLETSAPPQSLNLDSVVLKLKEAYIEGARQAHGVALGKGEAWLQNEVHKSERGQRIELLNYGLIEEAGVLLETYRGSGERSEQDEKRLLVALSALLEESLGEEGLPELETIDEAMAQFSSQYGVPALSERHAAELATIEEEMAAAEQMVDPRVPQSRKQVLELQVRAALLKTIAAQKYKVWLRTLIIDVFKAVPSKDLEGALGTIERAIDESIRKAGRDETVDAFRALQPQDLPAGVAARASLASAVFAEPALDEQRIIDGLATALRPHVGKVELDANALARDLAAQITLPSAVNTLVLDDAGIQRIIKGVSDRVKPPVSTLGKAVRTGMVLLGAGSIAVCGDFLDITRRITAAVESTEEPTVVPEEEVEVDVEAAPVVLPNGWVKLEEGFYPKKGQPEFIWTAPLSQIVGVNSEGRAFAVRCEEGEVRGSSDFDAYLYSLPDASKDTDGGIKWIDGNHLAIAGFQAFPEGKNPEQICAEQKSGEYGFLLTPGI